MAPKRVLFATIGASPQVLTETLWALEQADPPWRPDEIHIVTTSLGQAAIEKARSAGAPLSPEHISAPLDIIVPSSKDGELHDIDTADSAALMANAILRRLAMLAADDNTEIHVSIAGGRKTMSADAARAASLVCRSQDRVSHVLVTPQSFESNPTFWRPDQKVSCVNRDGAALDPGLARVSLVDVPTPLLRYRVSDPNALATLDFRHIVAELNATRAAKAMTLLISSNEVEYGGRVARLSPLLFALYRLIATARLEQWAGAGPEGVGLTHKGWIEYRWGGAGASLFPPLAEKYISYIRDAFGEAPEGGARADSVRQCFAKKDQSGVWRPKEAHHDPVEDLKDLLGPTLTRLDKELKRAFGPILSARLRLQRPRKRGSALRFGLGLEPEEIAIHGAE